MIVILLGFYRKQMGFVCGREKYIITKDQGI